MSRSSDDWREKRKEKKVKIKKLKRGIVGEIRGEKEAIY